MRYTVPYCLSEKSSESLLAGRGFLGRLIPSWKGVILLNSCQKSFDMMFSVVDVWADS